jgi:hypothetical protein
VQFKFPVDITSIKPLQFRSLTTSRYTHRLSVVSTQMRITSQEAIALSIALWIVAALRPEAYACDAGFMSVYMILNRLRNIFIFFQKECARYLNSGTHDGCRPELISSRSGKIVMVILRNGDIPPNVTLILCYPSLQ